MFVSCSSDWIASLTLVYFVLVVEVGVGGSGRLLTVILLLNRSVYKEEEKKTRKYTNWCGIYIQSYTSPLDEEMPLITHYFRSFVLTLKGKRFLF